MGNEIYTFAMLGQSNMVGQVPSPGIGHLPLNSPLPWLFGNDDQWKGFYDPYDDWVGQVDSVSADGPLAVPPPDIEARYGPVRSFLHTLMTLRPGRKFAVIPCAKGASSIAQWQRNLSASTLYGSALRRMNLAKATKKKVVIVGIIFYQGEQEATSLPLSATWASSFSSMVNDFRSDLAMPVLPVIFTKLPPRLVPHAWYPNWDDLRANQLTVSMPAVTMADVDDIAMPDYVSPANAYESAHLTVATYDHVGSAWASIVAPLIP